MLRLILIDVAGSGRVAELFNISYRNSAGWVLKKIRAQFITGIFVIVPIGITLLILIWLFNTIDNILQPVIVAIWDQRLPGVGFGVTLLLIYLAGLLTSNFAGKRLVLFAESALAKIPLVRQLYQGLKQITESFSKTNKNTFMQVVFVEFPGKGMKAIGFITNELRDSHTGEKLFSVFIPTAPNPASGFLEILREQDMVRTKIPVDEAIKMVVSVGAVSPKKIG